MRDLNAWHDAAHAADVLLAGLPIQKALDPTNDADFVKIVARLARDLESKRRRVTMPALRRAIDSLDVDWPGLTDAGRREVMRAANAAVTLAESRVLPTLQGTIETRGEGVAKDTRRALVRRTKVRVPVTLDANDKKVIRSIARHGVLFRDELGRRSRAFERIGTRVIEDGLKKGLRTDVITRNLSNAARLVHLNRSEHYMRIVANQAVNSARVWSELSGLQKAGVEEYLYYAIMDERTCPICEMFHELRFRVDDALNRYLSIAEDPDPEAVLDLKPWIRLGPQDEDGTREMYVQDRRGLRTTFARTRRVNGENTYPERVSLPTATQLGISYPPQHGLCRCTILMG